MGDQPYFRQHLSCRKPYSGCNVIVRMRDPTRADLAKELRRVLDGVSNMSDLARQLGVARDTIYKWRRGDSIPDLETIGKIANLTETTIRLEFGPEAPPDRDEIAELREQVAENSRLLARILGSAP